MTEPLDKILKAAFSSNDAPSILQRIEKRGGKAPRILLRDIPGDNTPVNRPGGPDQQGRYEVVGEIARGGVGVILKGRDVDLGRDVAIKVLLDRHTDNAELIERFIEEAQVGGQLQHPGIVPVYELGLREDGRPFFAMKLIKGETLANRLAARDSASDGRGALVGAFAKTCETIAYAHDRGVIHRDLKPSNIMLGSYGEVLVVDWGFAKILGTGGIADEARATRTAPDVSVIASVRSEGEGSSGSVAGSVMGTPAYMPPEQALGEVERLDERSDVFSLGGVLCEILTGAPPYVGPKQDLILLAAQAKLEDANERLDACDADPELVQLCRECLSPKRTDRPKTAQVIAARLRAYQSSLDERAEAARLEVVRAHGRRRMWLVASVFVVVAGIGGLWFQNREHDRDLQAHADVEAAMREASELRAVASASPEYVEAEWIAARDAGERATELAKATGVLGAATAKAARRIETAASDERIAHEQRLARTHARIALIEARALRDPEITTIDQDEAYRKAFKLFGIGETAPDLSDHPDRDEIIAALDDWGKRPSLVSTLDTDKLRTAIRSGELDTKSVEVNDSLPWLTLILLGRSLILEEQHDRAREAFALAVEIAPNRPIARFELAWADQNGKRYRAASRSMQRAYELLESTGSPVALPALHCLVASFDQRSGARLAAIERLRAVHGREANRPMSRPLLHRVLLEHFKALGRTKDVAAVRFVREAAELMPDDADTQLYLAWMLNNVLLDYERAVEHAERALELNCTNRKAVQSNLRFAHTSLGNWSECESAVRAELGVAGKSAETSLRVELARTLARQGKRTEALRSVDEFLREYETTSGGPTSWAYLAAGMTYAKFGEWEKAKPLLRKAIESLGTSFGAVRVLIMRMRQVGDLKGVRAEYLAQAERNIEALGKMKPLGAQMGARALRYAFSAGSALSHLPEFDSQIKAEKFIGKRIGKLPAKIAHRVAEGWARGRWWDYGDYAPTDRWVATHVHAQDRVDTYWSNQVFYARLATGQFDDIVDYWLGAVENGTRKRLMRAFAFRCCIRVGRYRDALEIVESQFVPGVGASRTFERYRRRCLRMVAWSESGTPLPSARIDSDDPSELVDAGLYLVGRGELARGLKMLECAWEAGRLDWGGWSAAHGSWIDRLHAITAAGRAEDWKRLANWLPWIRAYIEKDVREELGTRLMWRTLARSLQHHPDLAKARERFPEFWTWLEETIEREK